MYPVEYFYFELLTTLCMESFCLCFVWIKKEHKQNKLLLSSSDSKCKCVNHFDSLAFFSIFCLCMLYFLVKIETLYLLKTKNSCIVQIRLLLWLEICWRGWVAYWLSFCWEGHGQWLIGKIENETERRQIEMKFSLTRECRSSLV